MHEIPQFQELVNAMRDVPEVVFVFSQVREPYADARRWLEQRGIRLPLYDSGSHVPQDTRLQLASGGTLDDRAVAPVFPATYVFDRHGIVVFSLRGSASDWLAGVHRLPARRRGAFEIKKRAASRPPVVVPRRLARR